MKNTYKICVQVVLCQPKIDARFFWDLPEWNLFCSKIPANSLELNTLPGKVITEYWNFNSVLLAWEIK